MVMKGQKVLRVIVTVCLMATLVMTFCVQAFAWTAGMGDIKNGVLTVPESVTVLNENTVPLLVNAYNVKKIEIPKDVDKIEKDAFKNCENLSEVTIDNYEGAVEIEKGAFPNGVKVKYLQEKPTVAAISEKPTAAPTTAAPTTTKAPATTKKAPTTTKKVTTTTTTAPEETTTEEVTTEEETTAVEVTDSTPFADAKEQLAEVDVWDKLVGETTGPAAQPKQRTSQAATVGSYAAVVMVAISAVGLGYLKFRK